MYEPYESDITIKAYFSVMENKEVTRVVKPKQESRRCRWKESMESKNTSWQRTAHKYVEGESKTDAEPRRPRQYQPNAKIRKTKCPQIAPQAQVCMAL